MAFKKIRQKGISAETPEALLRDLKNRKVEGLLSHQADILREYCKGTVLNKSDVAIELPTGSGKTLIGLLIGEWRRRHFGERVVFLCPTRQLVNQVVGQSINKYGIKANAFLGKKADFSPNIKAEYTNAETIAVTTYSALFNTNSFFDNADLIIIDDAHAAENYIAKYWSLLIERHKGEHKIIFQALVSAVKNIVPDSHYRRLCNEFDDVRDTQWIEKIPTPKFYERLSEITEIIDEYANQIKDLKFSWSVIKDHLFACNIYCNSGAFLIRPLIPPTRSHTPFSNPKQRIYMSATLGEGGELERLAGVEKIVRLSVPEGWDKQGIGRRFFSFPERCLEEKAALNLTLNMMKETPRSLILVPDEYSANEIKNQIEKKLSYKVFNAKQIEYSKEPFIQEEKAVAVVANRYDGIDLVGDECRLLIIKGLQKSTNLQERFLVTRMPAAILFYERILTRIIQAVGRCTRSPNDYASVVIIGDELSNFLLDKDRRPFLHPEIQAELEFGIEQSKDLEESEFIENLIIFLLHTDDWIEVEEDIISLRNSLEQSKLPAIDKLSNAVVHEVRYQYAIWNGNFEQAFNECRSVLDSLSGDDVKGYRAFWYYLAASVAWIAADKGINSMQSIARDFFDKAANTAEEITWLYELPRLNSSIAEENQTEKLRLSTLIESLEIQLSKLKTANNKRFEKEEREILENLNRLTSTKEDSTAFENGHERLGRLLGYTAENSEGNADPDPRWMIGDDFCIVFEDHSGTSLGANKVRQAASHPNWIKRNLNLRQNAQIIPVIVTPCKSIEEGATPHTGDICYWNQQEFIDWAKNAISVVRDLRRSFPGEASLEWRKRAMQAYKDNGLDPASLAKNLSESRLSNLPTKG